MTDQYKINRHAFSERMWDGAGSRAEAALGGQLEWFWGVPGVFRALASPATNEFVPAAPREGDPHQQSCGYWAALHHLLLHRLGWAKPDLGLRWWYEAGKPVDDPTLALVSEVWDRDGNLDAYLAWLLPGRPEFLGEARHFAEWPNDLQALPPEWACWLSVAQAELKRIASHPLVGGWDPLHLTGHSGNTGRDDAAALVEIDRHARRAVFLSDDMNGWYFGLEGAAKRALGTSYGSWRVDVYVRSVGFLGTYRRSHQTGLWFVGRHRNHSPGN